MRVAFRADASVTIGSGHIMRCLALADMLRAQGDETLFLCRDFPGNLNAQIEQRGHLVHRLPVGAETQPGYAGWLGSDWQSDAAECTTALKTWGRPDWLVADHYAIDQRWENLLHGQYEKLMVIDDLADRPHQCDLLLDQNLQSRPARYRGLLPQGSRCLLGPRFALLRPEFHQLRQTMRPRDGRIGRLLVFLGGGDPENFTATVLHGVLDSGLAAALELDVIIGAANPHRPELEALCRQFQNACLHVQTPHVAALMASADLMIGAAGTTTWERCCLGLPSLLVSLADNQRDNGRQIARQCAALYLGDAADTPAARLSAVLRKLAARSTLIRRIGQRAAKITAGCGATLLTLAMRADRIELRAAGPDDCESIWRWRNDPRTRKTAFDPRPIALAAHRNWYQGVFNNPRQVLLIGAIGNRDIGVLRYDIVENAAEDTAEISVYLDPDLHGLGLGSRLIAAGNRWIAASTLLVGDLVARVRPENTASLKAFAEAGFHAEGDDPLTLHWRPAPAPNTERTPHADR